MTKRLLASTLWLFTCAAGVTAQALPYDHVHMAVPDPAKAVEWYVTHFGARRGDMPDRVVFGRTIFAFTRAEATQPSVGGVIDHVGLSVEDLDKTMQMLQAAGVKVLNPVRDVPGLFKLAFIEDPWGVKIELVQDPETPGFHHIHLRVPDPEGSLAWYADVFGGERSKLKGRIDAVKYSNPSVWLLAQKADDVAPSRGRAIDHLGWAVPDVAAKVRDLKAKGAEPTEPRAVRHLSVAFVEGPAGVRVEMVQGRKDEELTGRP